MRKHNGFTLIEILVVVAILGVLMGLVSILVLRSGAKKAEFLTSQTLTNLSNAVERYKIEGKMKRYPPMTLAGLTASSRRWKDLSIPIGNTTNECCEVLFVALKHPDLTTPLNEAELGLENPAGNSDEDEWNHAPPGMTGSSAVELFDAYGNPIVYFEKNGYGKEVTIINYLGDEVIVVALKKVDGSYYNPTSFQLISVGDNGVQDWSEDSPYLEDDLVHFSFQEGEG